MPVSKTELANSIRSIVGTDNANEEQFLNIDEPGESLVVRPGSADEVAACLRVCSEFDAAVAPAGEMTWLDWGNQINRADVVLSLTRMRRVIDYSPPDLTATVEAGLTLSELNEIAKRERQWLPLDPPGFRSASLGAVAACNSSGALRLGFGTPRDYVIGLKLAHTDGTQSKSGGRVVKNVAGYDMNKLYVGSYGTLAVITELTFKLRPMPETQSTIAITAQDREGLFDLSKRVLASELQPASVVLARGLNSLPRETLLIRFVDSEAAVSSQLEWVLNAISESYQATVLSDNEAQTVWSDAADLDARAIGVKLSLPLPAVASQLAAELLSHSDCVATADFGAGIIRMAYDVEEQSMIDQMKLRRASVAHAGGTVIIERAPSKMRREVDAWGDIGSTASLMRSIKEKFDPRSILNPGKFVLGV